LNFEDSFRGLLIDRPARVWLRFITVSSSIDRYQQTKCQLFLQPISVTTSACCHLRDLHATTRLALLQNYTKLAESAQ